MMKKRIIQINLIAALCLLASNLFAAGETALHNAAAEGNVAEVRRLLDAGADIEARDKYGYTPLGRAAAYEKTAVVTLLLNRGADINAKNNDGDTPLYTAAFSGACESTALLLNRGADINAKNNRGDTPLQVAVRNERYSIASLLRQAEARKSVVKKPGLPVLSKENLATAKRTAAEKLSGMNMAELLSEQPLDSEGAVLALSDALLEAESEKLPAYLLQNPGSEAKLLVEVKKRLRDAQVEMTKCNNKAQIMLSDGNSTEAERMLNLAAAIQGYQASLLSIKSELEKY
jgi:ankyrin repeat protein